MQKRVTQINIRMMFLAQTLIVVILSKTDWKLEIRRQKMTTVTQDAKELWQIINQITLTTTCFICYKLAFFYAVLQAEADRGVGDWGSCPRHQGRGTKEGRGEQNMWGHSLEILPRAPETIDPPLTAGCVRAIKTEPLKLLEQIFSGQLPILSVTWLCPVHSHLPEKVIHCILSCLHLGKRYHIVYASLRHQLRIRLVTMLWQYRITDSYYNITHNKQLQ